MKKLLSFVIVLIVMSSVCVPVFATNSDKIEEATKMADELKKLGLFVGTNKGYELDREPTRVEGLVMLIRLLGEEKEALNSNYSIKFKDVDDWAKKYASYGYNNNLAYGISETMFGANSKITASQYITFVLRSLGYNEKEAGYTWDNSFVVAEKIGLIKENEYNAKSEFSRADVVIISYRALDIQYNNEDITLRKKLFSIYTDKGQYEFGKAGFFVTEELGGKLNVIDKSKGYDSVLSKLNGQLGDTYFLWYKPGMTNGMGRERIASFQHDSKTDRYGLRISAWRKTYDSDYMSNMPLNVILETFYYLCGDKEVAMGLWNWFDVGNINGYSYTEDFGFKDVEIFENGFIITMNGINITITNGGSYFDFYFD